MNLSELKTMVDAAVEKANEYGARPEEIKVSLQIDGPDDESRWTDKEVELYYDNDAQASGCVLTGFWDI